MVCFGSDPLLGHGGVPRGKEALAALEFYVHMDLFANTSASFADLLLPAATGWELEALKDKFFWRKGQHRRRCVLGADAQGPRPTAAGNPLGPCGDLRSRLPPGLGEHFFGGDVEAAWRHQLEPSGLTLEKLRALPLGVKAEVATHHRKYAGIDPQTGRPRGFATRSRRAGNLFNPI